MSSPGAGTGRWRVGDLVADLYRVLEVHGEGAMGLVYRVRHTGWDVDLAVKSPRAERFRGDEDRERFVREAQTWVELGAHPHVCTCYYVRTIDGVPRVFAEYVAGGSLSSRIGDGSLYRGTPREVLDQVLDIAVQVAWGLAYTHDQGVVHQDVKPGNVLLDQDGTARVTDFGLARARQLGTAEPAPDAGAARSLLVTWAGMTPGYASPEQDERQPLSRRTDVWSFATSVLEMFNGGISWRAGRAAGAALDDYLEDGPPQPGLPAMPAAVADLLGRCLREDPAERPDSMASVAAALIGAYERELGTRYPRRVADPAQLRSDGLNNKALSLLDLGRPDEAREAFARALEIDPQHPETVYNQGLLDWRAGRIGDDELLGRLRLAGAGARGDAAEHAMFLEAQVQLESGRPEAVSSLLETATRKAPLDPAVPALLYAATAMLTDYGRRAAQSSVTFTLRNKVEAVAMTPDARLILAGQGSQLECHDVAARRRRELAAPRDIVGTVALSADGTRALSGHNCGRVCLWDTASGRLLAELEGPVAWVRACQLSSDGRLALTADQSQKLHWWDTTSPRLPQRVITLMKSRDYDEEYEVTVKTLRTMPPRPPVPDEPGEWVDEVALSADGQTALMAGDAIRMWDVPTGRLLLLKQCEWALLAMLPDASRALFAEEGNTLLWCDLSGERPGSPAAERRMRVVRRLADGPNRSLYAAVSADGRLAVSGDVEGVVRWWDLATGRCLRTDADPRHRGLASVALSADGRTRALSYKESVDVGPAPAFGDYTAPYELCRPVPLRELTHRRDRFAGLLAAARSAMGRQRNREAYDLLVQARGLPGHERDERALSAWRELSSRLPRTGLRGAWPAGAVRFSDFINDFRRFSGGPQIRLLADGRRALCGDEYSLRLWDLATGSCLREFTEPGYAISSIALSPDQRTALSCSGDRVRHWDLDTGRCLATLQVAGIPGWIGKLCFGADGRRCYAAVGGGLGDGGVVGWELADGSLVTRYQTQRSRTKALCASTDGRWLVSFGSEREMLRHDVGEERTVQVFLKDHLNAGQLFRAEIFIDDADLTPDGGRVVTANSDGRVRVWQIEDTRLLHTVDGQENPDGTARATRSVSVGPDGRFAVAGGDDGRVWMLDLHTGRWLQTLSGHTGPVTSVHVGGQGRYAVSAGWDGTLRRWELDWELDPGGTA